MWKYIETLLNKYLLSNNPAQTMEDSMESATSHSELDIHSQVCLCRIHIHRKYLWESHMYTYVSM